MDWCFWAGSSGRWGLGGSLVLWSHRALHGGCCLSSRQTWGVSLISAGSGMRNFPSTSQQLPLPCSPLFPLPLPRIVGCDTWGSPGSPCPSSISLCDPGTSLPPARIEGDGLETTLIDNKIEASPGITKPLRLSSTWARGWAPLLFPLRHVMDAPFHFRFHSSQPGCGKAEPELGAVSGCRVLREVFFQNHLAEHPQILFCWCHVLYALP